MSTQQPPPPQAQPATRTERVRNYLAWGFGISILIHLIGGPFIGQLRYHESQQPEVQKVSVSKKPVKVVIPTPRPTLPPTPPPQTTPPPQKSTPPPAQPKQIKLNIPKTQNNTNANAVPAYVPPKTGSENGVPQAQGTAAGTAPPAAPTAAPTAANCAQPNVPAGPKNLIQPDYPEMAREQGLSGAAKVKVTLDAQGNVTNAVINPGGSLGPLLDKEAIKAAKASTFTPEIKNCVPISGDYLFTAEFITQ